MNQSVIGQQHALSGLDNPTLNKNVAPPGRDRGTGEVAGQIVINQISQALSESNNDVSKGSRNCRRQSFIGPSTPRRQPVPHNGRGSRNIRYRYYNVSNYPILPPSTGRHKSIKVDQIKMGYNSIVDSIKNLAYQQTRTRNRMISIVIFSSI